MEKVNGETLFDLYEDDPENVPLWIWDEIRRIVLTLHEEEGIEYVDISPFNFMKLNDKILVIDFGDAKYVGDEPDWFLQEFLDGTNMWNPDFK
jgi:tRNA A-37 threonylcarbamoyl transferase component Bud32